MENKRMKFSIEIVGGYIKDIHLKHVKIARKTSQRFEDIGTEKEKYLKEIFRLYMIINESAEKIKLTETFLSIKRIPVHYSKGGLEEIEYYRYHIEYFHIKCISVLDFCVRLINHALRLGIPKRKCNVYRIIENTVLQGQPIIQKLKDFEEEFKKIKADRHMIIHQGDYESDSLSEIDSTIISNDFFDHGEMITKYFAQEKKKKKDKTIKIIRDQVTRLEFHVNEIYGCLIPLVKKQIKYFEMEE